MRTRLPIWLVIGLLLAAVPIQAQGGGDLAVLCSAPEDWCAAMTRTFEDQTGIDTRYVRMTSGEALDRLLTTAAHPYFSVWWGGSAEVLIAAADQGLLESYASLNAPLIEPQCRRAMNQTWIGVYVGALGFCSNTAALDDLGLAPPESWEALLDPALHGQVVLGHPATSGTSYLALWTQVVLQADVLERAAMEAQGMAADEIDETLAAGDTTGAGFDTFGFPSEEAIEAALAYFAALNENIQAYPRAGSTAGLMVAQGEAGVAVVYSYDCALLRVEGDASDLAVTFPAEGTGYGIGGMALIAGAPQTGAARRFYDWALTAPAQAILQSVGGFHFPANSSVDVEALGVSLADVALIHYDCELAGLMRDELIERFTAEVAPPPD